MDVEKAYKAPFYIFRHYETVKKFFIFLENFKNFSMSPESRSFIFFDILQQTGFSKSPNSPPSTILKTLRFLSLGCGADFRRSRLVFSSDHRPRRVCITF